MQFKASTDYGLRAVLYLASRNAVCSSRDIAEDMSIPRDYLIQLAQQLRNAGIVEARPGKRGGYCLAKPAEETTVLSVLDALEEESGSVMQARRVERQQAAIDPEVKPAYDSMLERIERFFGEMTLADLLARSEKGRD